MADRPDIAALFTPQDQSAALIFLRRILGCTFDHVWVPGGASGSAKACTNVGDILAVLVTTLNWAMLAVIAIVATWLIFAAIKDTANDGEVGGRQMSPSWTLVMSGLAAILCFPAFNGFSALQVGTMQVAVWSSGLGDSMWSLAAKQMASSTAVNKTFTNLEESGWWSKAGDGTEADLRASITQALQARVGGELCRRSMNASLQNMASSSGQIVPVSGSEARDSEEGFASRTLYYQAPASLNASTGLCGRVTANYSVPKATHATSSNAAGYDASNRTTQRQIETLISEAAARTGKAGADAILAAINAEGARLAGFLYPENGTRERGTLQLQAIRISVDNVVNAAKSAINAQFDVSGPQLKQAASQAMMDSDKNGWFFAVLYQRVLVTATTARDGIRKGISVSATPASRDLASVLGCVSPGSWNIWQTTCNSQLEVFFKQYSVDMAHLDQLRGAFLDASTRNENIGSNSADIPALRGTGIGFDKAVEWVMGTMTGGAPNSKLSGEGWSDPIPQLQLTGAAMLDAGGALLIAAKAGEIAAESWAGQASLFGFMAGKLIEMVGPLGWMLVALGFLLAVVVPYMPLVYFFLAALHWLILAVQTIITAPFWLMQMFYPNRGGGLSGTSLAKALNVLLALLMKPALIIVGLVFCMVLMRNGLDFLNIITRNAFSAMVVSSPSAAGADIGKMALLVGGFAIYVTAAVSLVSICCGLIDGVGDWAMDAVENGLSRVSGSDRQRGDMTLGNPISLSAANIGIGGRGSLAGTGAGIARIRKERGEWGSGTKQIAGTR